jgi:hypothetical protein
MEGIPFVSADSRGEMPESGNGVMLILGDWTYMWDKTTKKGTKMSMREMDAMTEGFEEEEEEDDFDAMTEEWENSGFEYECREIKEEKGMFVEPSNIEFQNLNEMMGGFSDTGNKIQEQIDSGEEIDMEELEKMMQGLQ